MEEAPKKPSGGPERRSRLVAILHYSERVIYYGAAFAVLVTVGMLFASAGTALVFSET